ncbi:MAG: toll/interleukin-1 receptor domain-containing protein [Rhodospirillaceae bacterium]
MANVFSSYSYFGNAVYTDSAGGAPVSKVFISYDHGQKDWVEGQLVSVLRAGGADMPMLHAGGGEELIDTERSPVGAATTRRLMEAQTDAERQILVLSPGYLANASCVEQMKFALSRDPEFRYGLIIPVMRESCSLPAGIKIPESAVIDLRNGKRGTPWQQLLGACSSQIGTSALAWLKARDAVMNHMKAGRSVNLVVDTALDGTPMVMDLRDRIPGLATLDIEGFKASSRRGLLAEILRIAGCNEAVPATPGDLELFKRYMATAPTHHIALLNFDNVRRRLDFDQPLFESLAATLASTPPGLALLCLTRQPLNRLLPAQNPLVKLNLPVVTLAPDSL